MKPTIIFTYHEVIETRRPLYLYELDARGFRFQMRHLCGLRAANSGFNFMLTFDDGYSSWVKTVLPVLEVLGLKALFFICGQYVLDNRISPKDIVLLKKRGMSIGSHSLTHCFLNTLEEPQLFYELNTSKKVLEDITQDEVNDFSIPRGVASPVLESVCRQAGYSRVFTSQIGVNYQSSYFLKRVPIRRDTHLAHFKDLIYDKRIAVLARRQRIKDAAKNILGIEKYNYLRKVVIPYAE